MKGGDTLHYFLHYLESHLGKRVAIYINILKGGNYAQTS